MHATLPQPYAAAWVCVMKRHVNGRDSDHGLSSVYHAATLSRRRRLVPTGPSTLDMGVHHIRGGPEEEGGGGSVLLEGSTHPCCAARLETTCSVGQHEPSWVIKSVLLRKQDCEACQARQEESESLVCSGRRSGELVNSVEAAYGTASRSTRHHGSDLAPTSSESRAGGRQGATGYSIQVWSSMG